MKLPGHGLVDPLVVGASIELKRDGTTHGTGALCMMLTKNGSFTYLTCSHVAFGQPGDHGPGGELIHLPSVGQSIGKANDDGMAPGHRLRLEVATVEPNGWGNPSPRRIFPNRKVATVEKDIESIEGKTVFMVGPMSGEREGIAGEYLEEGQHVPGLGILPCIMRIKGTTQRFAAPGDSGSPIFIKLEGNKVLGVAILVAVDPDPNKWIAYAHPLCLVFNKDSLGLDEF
ncbi:MAG: hypothetical protein FJ303_10165 [Planctomycetes bacterium]|nr:hypothetical protein [Planctomycetota bacterium]